MNISDTVMFEKHIEFEVDDKYNPIKVVGYVSTVVDKTNLKYNLYVQIFDKEFYEEDTDSVNEKILNFLNEVAQYLKPTKESELIEMLSYRNTNNKQ